MINFKYPLQPHQNYYTTQYEELHCSQLTQMKSYYTTNSHYFTHTFLFKRLGECTVLFELGNERINCSRLPVQPFQSQLNQCWSLESSVHNCCNILLKVDTQVELIWSYRWTRLYRKRSRYCFCDSGGKEFGEELHSCWTTRDITHEIPASQWKQNIKSLSQTGLLMGQGCLVFCWPFHSQAQKVHSPNL